LLQNIEQQMQETIQRDQLKFSKLQKVQSNLIEKAHFEKLKIESIKQRIAEK